MSQTPNELPPDRNYDGERETNQDARTMAMLCHLSGLVLGFLGPLIFWLIKKDEHAFVDDQGKEALNFQISILIYFFVSAASIIILVGILLIPAIGIFSVVMSIIAGLKANDGEYYRYPLTIRLIT